MRLNPFLSFMRTAIYVLRGRLHFPGSRIGEIFKIEDGEELIVFREVIVNQSKDQPENHGATFRIRCHVARMSPRQN